MLNNISFKYYNTNSLIHKLNSIVKIISLFIFLITIFITDNIYVELLLFLFLVLVIFLSDVKFSLFLRSIWKMKYFILMYIIINLLCGGTYLATLVVVLRFIMVILYSFLLTYTTKSTDITHALEKILNPLKKIFCVKGVILMITLSLQFIPIIIDQTNKIMKSLASRGRDYKQAKVHEKFDILKAIMIPMFLLSMKRADEVASAYEVRHYSLTEESMPFIKYKMNYFDYFYVSIHLLFLMMVIILEVVI